LPFGKAQLASNCESGAAAATGELGEALAVPTRIEPPIGEKRKRRVIENDVIDFLLNTFIIFSRLRRTTTI
jgi:hypothetical protein